VEIMGANLRTKESIMQGESEGRSFYEIIEASNPFGWRTFDFSCLEAYKKGLITEETALLNSSKRGHVTRGIDLIKKTRGENTSNIDGLHMTPLPRPDKKSSTAPPTLKLK
jgi:twitching motility protein PilT